ncbi:DUF6585 family protein [Dictyobacter aurantiacus]|uniref:DUF4097 domain-containing protein n=1 Tax=Dictyobacter aurantiacus TaxID=1936993 RepID=A0A401ZRU6_9CHLR|nr:DUF6585 family protein [Dictyobacter aurantiacus]GCE09591.1 hypothetical protein KDAU_69200 [Dictyobacter aurantiacus]
MIPQSFSPQMYESDEHHHLGTLEGVYIRHVTLSGKIALVGLSLSILFVAIDALLLLIWGAVSMSMQSPIGFTQSIFLVGKLLSFIRGEELIAPFLHPRLSVSIYTEGLIYRKGRRTRVVRWDEIQSIRRQFKIYRSRGKVKHVSPTYTCILAQQPDIVLYAGIDHIAEIGTLIEHKLTQRLLPQLQADYEANKFIEFNTFFLDQQHIGDWKQETIWRQVSRIEVGLENIVVEIADEKTDQIVVPATNMDNVCALEALLESIQKEKGFELSLTATPQVQSIKQGNPYENTIQRQQRGQTSWVSTLVLTLLSIAGLALQTWVFYDSLSQERLADLPAQTFQVSTTPTIIIKVDAIDQLFIRNKGNDNNQVSVEGWKKVTGIGSLDNIQQQATRNGNTINLSWTMQQKNFLGLGAEKVFLLIDIPVNSNVQIETRTGDLFINDINGEIKVKTQTGSINLQTTLRGHSQVQSTSGQINFCGSLDPQSSDLFKSDSGNINITLPSNAALNLSSSNSTNQIYNDFNNNETGTVPRTRLEITTRTGTVTIHKGIVSDPKLFCS